MNEYEFADVDIFMNNDTGEWTASWSGGVVYGDDLQDVLGQIDARGWQVLSLNGAKLKITYRSWQTNSATVAYCAHVKRQREQRVAD